MKGSVKAGPSQSGFTHSYMATRSRQSVHAHARDQSSRSFLVSMLLCLEYYYSSSEGTRSESPPERWWKSLRVAGGKSWM